MVADRSSQRTSHVAGTSVDSLSRSERRKHIFGDVALELFDGAKVLATEITTRNDDLVLLMHEG